MRKKREDTNYDIRNKRGNITTNPLKQKNIFEARIFLWFSGQNSTLFLLRAWIQSLVEELKSHKPHSMVKKKKNIKELLQFRAHKFNSLDEMGKFVERHKLLKLTQEYIDKMNSRMSF